MSKIPALKSAEVLRALQRGGFYVHHSKGSHHSLRHPSKSHLRVTVSVHAGDVKTGTLRSILDQAELSVDEFLKLI